MIAGFFEEVCRLLGLEATPWRLAFFNEWARFEGVPDWINNPLATTQPGGRSTTDIGWGPGKWNDANPPYGVGIYESPETGALKTWETLTNGYYPFILMSLRDQKVSGFASTNVRTWGTTGFANRLDEGWTPDGGTAMDEETKARIERLERVLFGGTDQTRDHDLFGTRIMQEIGRLDDLESRIAGVEAVLDEAEFDVQLVARRRK